MKIRAISYHSRNQRSFPRSRLEFGSSGRDSDLLARSIRGLSETKLEGCADSIKTIAHRSNTCYRHGPSISSLTTQLRLHYALNINSDPFKQKVSVLLDTLRCVATSPATLRNGGSGAQCGDCNKDTRSWPCFHTCSVAV